MSGIAGQTIFDILFFTYKYYKPQTVYDSVDYNLGKYETVESMHMHLELDLLQNFNILVF